MALSRWFIPPGPGKLAPYQEFHKEGSIILKSRFKSWGPRKIKSNAHFYSIFRIVEEEVLENGDSVNQQLFVEIFKDREAFIEMMVENLKKVEEVEAEMTGGVKRIHDDDLNQEEPEDLNEKIENLLTRFEEKDLVFITKFFKIVYKSNKPNLAICHSRIQKKAGNLSYNLCFKGSSLKTDCASLTNLDSNLMAGRGNTGSAFCTMVPLMDLSDDIRKRVLRRFDMDIEESENLETATRDYASSQDFPYTQSQNEDTIKICQVCRFPSRDKNELKQHMETHFKCETCGQYYNSQNELDHHEQNHMKVKCDLCNKFFRKDEMPKHKMHHLKLKTFGTKKLIKAKPIKPVTGYGLWQKEERKKITDDHPGMIFTDVNRELGKRWAAVEKLEKERWKTSAQEFNKNLTDPLEGSSSTVHVDIEPVVIIEEEVEVEVDQNPVGNETNAIIESILGEDIEPVSVDELLDITIAPIPADNVQEPPRKKRKTLIDKNTKCPWCDFEANDNGELTHHIQNEHRLNQAHMKKCSKCELVFSTEKKLAEHFETAHANTDNEIILVKMRKLSWPALVIKKEGDILEVRMLSDDSIRFVSEEECEPFSVEKVGNSKNTALKKAYTKALEIKGKQS